MKTDRSCDKNQWEKQFCVKNNFLFYYLFQTICLLNIFTPEEYLTENGYKK